MTITQVAVTIIAADPPSRTGHGVLFGLQTKSDADDPVPADSTTEFHTEIEIRDSDDHIDFAGPHVNGRRGDRFIYLAWGLPDQTMPFVMFARAKIRLETIPRDLLDHAIEQGRRLVAELQATNAQGQPASGTIKPPDIRWTID